VTRLSSRALASLAAVFLASCTGSPDRVPDARLSSIQVGDNVLVSSANPRRPHGEMLLAADPQDPDHLIACGSVGQSPGSSLLPPVTIAYVTFDRGGTWKPTLSGTVPSFDPSCTIGRRGRAYVGDVHFSAGWLLTIPKSASTSSMAELYSSSDYGRTWSRPVMLPFGDRDFLDVDNTRSPYADRIYYHLGVMKLVQNKQRFHFEIFHSTDEGKTFSEPAPGLGTTLDIQAGQGTILSDGTLMTLVNPWGQTQHDPFSNTDRSAIEVAVSRNGGRSFSSKPVTDWIARLNETNGGGIPSIAADTSVGPYRNRAYVVWNDARFGHNDILLAYSDDRGTTWSRPAIVDDTQPYEREADCMEPEVAVNKNGIVGVAWFDLAAEETPIALPTTVALSLELSVRTNAIWSLAPTRPASLRTRAVFFTRFGPATVQDLRRCGRRR